MSLFAVGARTSERGQFTPVRGINIDNEMIRLVGEERINPKLNSIARYDVRLMSYN